jgi:CubicO group peptidase (beta-lactamase class C family)
MKAIGNYFPNSEANVRALLAGNDMLCLPGNIPETIEKIKQAIEDGRLTKDDIDNRVIKVLTAKYKHGLANKQWIDTTNIIADLNNEVIRLKSIMAAQSLTYCNAQTTPVLNKQTATAYIALNLDKPSVLTKALDSAYGIKIFYVGIKDSLKIANLKDSLSSYQQVIVGLHNYNRRPANRFQIHPSFIQFLNQPQPSNWINVVLGNPYAVGEFNGIKNILFAYEDNDFTQKAVLQWLEGKIKATGTLPVTVTENLPFGTGDVKIQKLAAIDSLVADAIKKKALSGCQVLVAKDNKIIFNKAYGNTAGPGSSPVTLNTYYDLASVTKVTATTVSIMKLAEEGKVNIDKTIGDYLPWVKGNAKEKITLKDLLLHQAGLFPYIKFYESLLQKDGLFKQGLVSNKIDPIHHQFISPNKYLIDNWSDTIKNQILKSPVTEPGKYVYSDNDFIFLGMIVEKVSGMDLDAYTQKTFYKPMGMQSTGFLPLGKTNSNNIAATEVDDYYRHELIRGSVHDEGASTMGGIAGHAGLFSNASDLAKLYLMLMNNGKWEGQQYLQPNTIMNYTGYQNESRRGLGFDKPEKNNKSRKDPYPSLSPSAATFGHTGFTGTCVWADPENGILYIFLSNRVFPTRDSKVFNALNLRPNIQEAIYTALK